MTRVKTTYSDILKVSLPVIVSSIAMTILNITDTAFLGRVGETELGASAVGGVLYFAFATIGISIGTGSQIMIARRTGENREDAIGNIFDHSLLILATLGITLFALLKWGSPLILNLILTSPELIEATIQFIDYRSFGLIFIMIATAYRSLYVGIARPAIIAVYSFLMAGVNIILCYVLIFGKYGMPQLGIEGAGIASSVAEFIALVFIIVYTSFRAYVKKFRLLNFNSISKEMIVRIKDLSMPLAVQNLLSLSSWFIFFVFIEKIGKHELAISNIIRGAYMIGMTPIWGFSIAANSMISNIIGQQKSDEAISLLNKILHLTIVTALLMILINVFFPEEILRLFTNDAELVAHSRGSLMVINFAMLFFAVAIVTISTVSGTGATKTALRIEIAAIIIYLLYNYIVTFILHGTLEMLWVSEIIYWLFTGAVSYYFLLSGRWKKIRV